MTNLVVALIAKVVDCLFGLIGEKKHKSNEQKVDAIEKSLESVGKSLKLEQDMRDSHSEIDNTVFSSENVNDIINDFNDDK